jgi:uncharacterized membrane protein YedE/YeeE
VALFGVGWGIAGFCSGGALPALGTGKIEVILLVVSLIASIFAANRLMKFTTQRAQSEVAGRV